MKFQRRVVQYEDVDLEADEVLTLSEAAKLLGMTIQGVSAAVNRGQLMEFVDPDALTAQRRRFLLREEVEVLAGARRRAREKWEGAPA